MATVDYYSMLNQDQPETMPGDPGGIPPTQTPTPPAPQPPAPTTTTPEARKKQIVDAFVIPGFTTAAGRPPTQQEIDEYYDIYERFGETAMQGKIGERFPKAAGQASTPWFDQNAPTGPGDYTAGAYTPPTFTEPFVGPTAESLQSDPGYQSRMQAGQRGFERSAAAKGSLLSGGFVGRTLPRALGELASNEYSNAFGRAFDTYQQKYGQFSDAASRSADAFKTNETGKLNQYSTRYKSYQDIIAQRRQAEQDRWNREMDLAHLGSGATGGQGA